MHTNRHHTGVLTISPCGSSVYVSIRIDHPCALRYRREKGPTISLVSFALSTFGMSLSSDAVRANTQPPTPITGDTDNIESDDVNEGNVTDAASANATELEQAFQSTENRSATRPVSPSAGLAATPARHTNILKT